MSARIIQLKTAALVLAVALASASCGDVVRTGRSPMILIIDSITGASGATPGQLGVPLLSDVVTMVKQTVGGVEQQVPTIYNDVGKATMRMVLKDQGAPAVTATPTLVNAITVTRYRVEFIRADGRNTQGVDVPYAFDGGTTATILNGASDVPFELVRSLAKEEAPLRALRFGGGANFIATIAKVTFYGKDLGGNDVEASGNISVNFADFADPQ
jgi:hypothetical protein